MAAAVSAAISSSISTPLPHRVPSRGHTSGMPSACTKSYYFLCIPILVRFRTKVKRVFLRTWEKGPDLLPEPFPKRRSPIRHRDAPSPGLPGTAPLFYACRRTGRRKSQESSAISASGFPSAENTSMPSMSPALSEKAGNRKPCRGSPAS